MNNTTTTTTTTATATTIPLNYEERRRILFIDPYDKERIDGYNKELRGLYEPYLLERVAYLAVQEPYYVDMFSKLGYKGTCINCKTSTKYILEKFICDKCVRLVRKKRNDEKNAKDKEHFRILTQKESREVRRAAKAKAEAKAKAKAKAEAEAKAKADAEAKADADAEVKADAKADAEADAEALNNQNNQIQK
ncbi:hypothetical protein ACTFIW_001801 [Dictyostelium discoideum]